jgi:hypothetical protein
MLNTGLCFRARGAAGQQEQSQHKNANDATRRKTESESAFQKSHVKIHVRGVQRRISFTASGLGRQFLNDGKIPLGREKSPKQGQLSGFFHDTTETATGRWDARLPTQGESILCCPLQEARSGSRWRMSSAQDFGERTPQCRSLA